MKKRLFLAISISFLFLSAQAFADDGGKLFKVNVIIFTHINKKSLSSESWPKQLLMPASRGALSLAPYLTLNNDATDEASTATPSKPKTYQLLNPKSIGLKKMVKKLQGAGNTVLLDIAWVQPAIQTNSWIHIFGGQAYDAQGQTIANQTIDYNNMTPLTQAAYWQLNGLIRISYNVMFNVGTKLYLTVPQDLGSGLDAQALKLAPLQTYTLFANHRTHKNQFVYFDHPLMGAIVYITPVKQ
jgi:hypothetical protein